MGKVLGVVALVALGAIALAVIGPTLSPDNPLYDIGAALRDIGRTISRGFGGGYGELVQGN